MLTQEAYSSNKTETISVGDSSHGYVGSTVLQVEGSGWTGQLVIQGRVRGSGLTMKALPYQNLITLADVAAGTPITADGLYAVRADGLEIEIVHTRTAGAVSLAAKPLVG